MKIKKLISLFKFNAFSIYIIKAGFILMLMLYLGAYVANALLGTAFDSLGMMTTYHSLLEAAPACFGASVTAALICDIWYKDSNK